jgi:nicotinate-nucleotide adenylyltransferase
VAEEVGEAFELEKVYLMPAALPPHKDSRPLTPFRHRLEMIRLAAESSPLFEALDLEGRRQGLSYSIETLKEIHRIFPSPLDLFFVIGTDAFLEIETWKDYGHLFDYSNFIVIQRPGTRTETLESFILSLGMGFKKSKGDTAFSHPSGTVAYYREATLMDISSTRIREKVRSGRSVRFLVPEAVRVYIVQKELYRNDGIH